MHAEADRRLTLLEPAPTPVATGLPACMFRLCEFKDRCGCGDVA